MDLVADCFIVTDCFILTNCLIDLVTDCLIVTDCFIFTDCFIVTDYSYTLQRLSVKMNGFNSKVVCKNSSVTIWEILFNITIPIIHHKYRGGLVKTRGDFVKRPLSLWYAPPGRTQGGLMKTFHGWTDRCT